MKTLIVYFSRTSNTKTIALELKRKLNADIEEIAAPDLKLGFWGYLKAGHQAAAKKKVRIEALKHDLAEYGLVVVGTPVWVGTVSSPIRTFLQENGESLKHVAFFCTCGGSQNKTFAEMEAVSQKRPKANLEVRSAQVKKGDYEGMVASFVQEIQAGGNE